MQDPLKRNKAFKESYLSCQAHKKYLTPYNVETLMSSLQHLREQTVKVSSSSKKLRPAECSFVDSYLQSALPTVSHKPLITEAKPWQKVRGQLGGRFDGSICTSNKQGGGEIVGILGTLPSREKPIMNELMKPLPLLSDDRPQSSSGYSSSSRTTSVSDIRGNNRAAFRPELYKLLEMPPLEPSIVQSLTKPCSTDDITVAW